MRTRLYVALYVRVQCLACYDNLSVQTVVRGWQLGTQPHVRGATSGTVLICYEKYTVECK